MSYGMPTSAYQIPILAGSGTTFGAPGVGTVQLEPGFVQTNAPDVMHAQFGGFSAGSYGADDTEIAISDESIEAIDKISGALPGLTDAMANLIARHRESYRGLIRQRMRLKKQLARTRDSHKRQRIQEELEIVNMQIAALKQRLAEAGAEPEPPGPNWFVLAGAAGIVALIGVAVFAGRR